MKVLTIAHQFSGKLKSAREKFIMDHRPLEVLGLKENKAAVGTPNIDPEYTRRIATYLVSDPLHLLLSSVSGQKSRH